MGVFFTFFKLYKWYQIAQNIYLLLRKSSFSWNRFVYIDMLVFPRITANTARSIDDKVLQIK